MDRRVRELLERQAAWQRERARLPWAEKLRQSRVMREAMLAIRAGRKRSGAEPEAKHTR